MGDVNLDQLLQSIGKGSFEQDYDIYEQFSDGTLTRI